MEGSDSASNITRPRVAILQRLSAGERTAVQDCIDRYGGLVWALARKFSPTVAQAEEAVQEIFLTLWREAYRYVPTQIAEATFVVMLARRCLLDQRNAANAAATSAEIHDDLLDAMPGFVLPAEREVTVNAESALAARAVQAWKPTQQMLLQMAIYQGSTPLEIARATGLPLGTVRTQLRRGLWQMRAALGLRTLPMHELTNERTEEEVTQ